MGEQTKTSPDAIEAEIPSQRHLASPTTRSEAPRDRPPTGRAQVSGHHTST